MMSEPSDPRIEIGRSNRAIEDFRYCEPHHLHDGLGASVANE